MDRIIDGIVRNIKENESISFSDAIDSNMDRINLEINLIFDDLNEESARPTGVEDILLIQLSRLLNLKFASIQNKYPESIGTLRSEINDAVGGLISFSKPTHRVVFNHIENLFFQYRDYFSEQIDNGDELMEISYDDLQKDIQDTLQNIKETSIIADDLFSKNINDHLKFLYEYMIVVLSRKKNDGG